jgi:NitT/TauT family transport system ATP-binding protein
MNSNKKSNGTLVKIQEISKSYEGLAVLKNINFEVKSGEILAILGLSGCGKTTLLRIISGLILPTCGKVIKGNSSFSFVFEKSMLLPWKTVLENIMLPGILNGSPDRKKAKELVHIIGLDGYENYYPDTISCGMQQRVSIAMALATDSDIILMDEPFNSLDENTRYKMYSEIHEIMKSHKGKRKTIVYVTHSVEEAVFLSDRIIILSEKPTQLKATIEIDLPKVRNRKIVESAGFFKLENKVREHLI